MSCDSCPNPPLRGISHQRDNINPGAAAVFKNRKSWPVTEGKGRKKVKQVCGRSFPRCYFASRELIDGSAIIVTSDKDHVNAPYWRGHLGCPRGSSSSSDPVDSGLCTHTVPESPGGFERHTGFPWESNLKEHPQEKQKPN